MKKLLLFFMLCFMCSPAYAEYQSNYPLQLVKGNKEVKVKDKFGRTEAYIEVVDNNYLLVRNRWHQKSARYKVSGNTVKKMNYTGH